ncbi:hypothetical protein FCM35_KLT04020 [Carex littledalei]|uniref:Uncharacterized protein n=1 Tax=Carex littledalei TaxID=544730 RepID=A0A833R6G0_9POAL|nr:hypothetical protein FCM35_KLT04020 [Carex littledalei]
MSTSEIAKTIKRFLVLSIRLSYRSVCNHPVFISFGLLLLLLYQLFPSLFSFLLSTSPVLVCTTLLLGTILSFGQPNIPQIEEEEEEERTINTDQISLFSASEAADNIVSKNSEISAIQNTYVDQKPDIAKRELEEISFFEQAVTFSPKSDTLPIDTIQEKESVISDERSLSIEREVGESSFVYSKNPALEEFVDSPHWQRIDNHDASSGFESDGAESSSPDASMTDIIPLLEEIDPLLDLDSFPIQNREDDSDSSSQASSHDLLQVESADEEEEEDKSVKKGDESHETAFTWTADDQKNLMDLGYSEVERNRRLENLMARRRSRKNIRFDLDQNLINLDGNTTGSTTTGTALDDLSQFRVHVPRVSVQRENPFDSSFLDDNPVPGSAPSVLVPRRNPFDEPYEEPTENMVLSHESWTPRQYMSASHRDMLFTRHDSFNYSSGDFRQDRQFSRFKPFIVSDSGTDTIEEESSSNVGTFERQFSGNSGSKSSSPLETDTSSHVEDLNAGSNPVRHDEEMDEDEGSISSDDISSVAVQLDDSEFESNGGRESPSIHSGYFSSSEKVRPVDAILALLVWDDVEAEDRAGASSSSQPPLSELDSMPRDFGDIYKPVEPNTTPLASQQITNPSQENTIKTSQFSLMDLHPIPEEKTTEDNKPDKTNLGLPDPLESDQDSDEDADQIYPEPVEYNEIDEDLLTELDAVGDFAPRQHISWLEFQNTIIESNQQFGGPQNAGIEPGVGLVLEPNENPEQTVYNPRRHILHSTSTEEINALLDEVPDESHQSPVTVMKAEQSGEPEQSDMALLGSEVVESEIPGIVEETESGMFAVKAKSHADLESAFVQVATSLEGGEDTGVIDETESGMLVVKAKSIVDINTAFEQVRDALVGSAGTQSGDAEMGMVVLEAKSIDDIESAMMQISDVTASEDVGLVDETESGMLVVKASSKEDIDLVFKQVGEVIGKPDKVGVNAGFEADDKLDMVVLDAKSIDDIDSVMLNVSEVFEGSSYGYSGLVDETDSGMLVVKAKSVADIESVFKQVGEILRIPESDSGNAGTSQNAGGSENGMVVLDASSLDDIDSAILNASEANESEDAGLVDETESGMLVIKANSLADMNLVFKQVGEVLGKSDTGSESPKLVEDANSGIMVFNAKSIEDIDSAVMQVTEVTGTGNSGMVDETESNIKASSLADIDSVLQQVGETLGNTNADSENLGIVEESHSGILVIDAKSVDDIESAMLQVRETPGNTETGLVDETDSDMLVVKASSVADINYVFQQVGEVLGKQNAGSENPGIVEDSDSGMLVLDAKSVEDIGSAMLHVSGTCGDGVDLVLKQDGEVVNESSGNGIPESVDETESGMVVVNAKSLEDINLATKQVNSLTEVGDSKVATELPVVNGSNMEKE